MTFFKLTFPVMDGKLKAKINIGLFMFPLVAYMKLHYLTRALYETPRDWAANCSISNDEERFTIDELWMSLRSALLNNKIDRIP